MKFFRRKRKNNGLVDYYNLHKFWNDKLNEEERKIVFENFCKGSIGIDQSYLLDKKITDFFSKLNFIASQITRYIKPEFKSVGYKFIELGNDEVIISNNILDKHFYYTSLIQFYYRHRIQQENFNLTVKACKNLITISKNAKKQFEKEYENDSLPRHLGFEQLSIILEKQKKYIKSIEICRTAKNESWNGDWDKRIDRMVKKQEKLKQ